MKYIKTTLMILIVVSTIGCQEDLLDTYPKDKLSSISFWQTEEDAVNAVNAIYSFLPGIGELEWDMMSDIGHSNNPNSAVATIEKSEHNANLGYIENIWDTGYKAIRAVNYFLENVDAVKEKDATVDEELLNRLQAEARFIRALYYTRLVMLFGDIPLVIKTLDITESKEVTRRPKEQVWEFVESELSEITDHLPIAYSGNDIGRITKGAALAMKARAMLYAQRWGKAAEAAKAVMDMDVYSLYPSYEALFNYEAQNNSEVILDCQYAKDVASHNFFERFAPASLRGNIGICPTRTLVQAYETANGMSIEEDTSYNPTIPYNNRDPRLKYSIFIPTFSDDTPGEILYNGQVYDPRPGSGTGDEVEVDYRRTKTGFNIKKYINEEDENDIGNGGANFILIRYADVLLMYAEAKVEAGQIDPSVYEAINAVRQRDDVNMPPVEPDKSQAELLEIVRHERMVELALEGLRFFDIRRWKMAHELMQGAIPGMRYIRSGGSEIETLSYGGVVRFFDPNRDYLFPIPQQEIALNPRLNQNSGY